MADSVSIDYTVVKINQYTGRAKRVTPGEARRQTVARPIGPPPAREGGALEAPPEPPKVRIFASFPMTIGAQNCSGRGGAAVISTRKKSRKSQEKYMQRVAMR